MAADQFGFDLNEYNQRVRDAATASDEALGRQHVVNEINRINQGVPPFGTMPEQSGLRRFGSKALGIGGKILGVGGMIAQGADAIDEGKQAYDQFSQGNVREGLRHGASSLGNAGMLAFNVLSPFKKVKAVMNAADLGLAALGKGGLSDAAASLIPAAGAPAKEPTKFEDLPQASYSNEGRSVPAPAVVAPTTAGTVPPGDARFANGVLSYKGNQDATQMNPADGTGVITGGKSGLTRVITPDAGKGNTYDGLADLRSMANVNAMRQEMIDRQPAGSVGMIGNPRDDAKSLAKQMAEVAGRKTNSRAERVQQALAMEGLKAQMADAQSTRHDDVTQQGFREHNAMLRDNAIRTAQIDMYKAKLDQANKDRTYDLDIGKFRNDLAKTDLERQDKLQDSERKGKEANLKQIEARYSDAAARSAKIRQADDIMMRELAKHKATLGDPNATDEQRATAARMVNSYTDRDGTPKSITEVNDPAIQSNIFDQIDKAETHTNDINNQGHAISNTAGTVAGGAATLAGMAGLRRVLGSNGIPKSKKDVAKLVASGVGALVTGGAVGLGTRESLKDTDVNVGDNPMNARPVGISGDSLKLANGQMVPINQYILKGGTGDGFASGLRTRGLGMPYKDGRDYDMTKVEYLKSLIANGTINQNDAARLQQILDGGK